MNTDEYIKLSKQNIEETQRKVAEEINKYMKITEIKPTTAKNITSTYSFINKKTGNYYDIPTREEYEKEYEEITKNKVKGNMKQKAIKYAEIVIQPTTRSTLNLYERDKKIMTLYLYTTLPEHAQAFANYWIGQTIESNTIQTQVADFRNKMRALRIAKVKIHDYNHQKAKITSTSTHTDHL